MIINSSLGKAFEKIRTELRSFVELSMQEDDQSWEQWISNISSGIDVKCWEKKNCSDTECAAYKSKCRRCWIIAGSCSDNEDIQYQFVKKYTYCQSCDVFLEAVCKDPVTEIQEHLIILTHSLRAKQFDLRRIATTDSLTGLFNRNYFEMSIPREIEKAKRRKEDLLIFMIDIDKFKNFNDTYGHQYGDKILNGCAEILRKSVRSSDLLIRYGGDEFLVVMHPDSIESAGRLQERIMLGLDEWNNMNPENDSKLSLSIGSAVYKPGSLLTDVIKEADKEMYRNKFSKRTDLSPEIR
ncbi:MAG: GGDEF domain-containing protein [Proteobacteria bacterium]|jgi:diguanylate cyclase (GGDEF)-like protein|nr:GGDEF domain-containing protein [Desulfocapsa sp.]MBU3943784.1 GGDEF domain-containing protein [Pseudomonadota bacterium]MCG2744572.1 GGDEF domain-containing protein [Desulfobacteraceae bacterium]MBU4027306.1 GGDEF domain-containing protein [Pseudomonadota bacterium]MBU4042932.1 GGDEF domain-containing protein [Pseudomonadota bacterium]